MSEKFKPNPEKPAEGEVMRWNDNYPKVDKEEIEAARKRGREMADKLMGPEPIYDRPRFASKGKTTAAESGDQEQLKKTARRLAYMAQKKDGSENFEAEMHKLFGDKQGPAEISPREKYLNRIDNAVTLEAFTDELKELFEDDPWLRGQVGGWELVQMKSRDPEEPRFKLVVVFENNQHKRKKEKTIISGTRHEIMEALNEELAFYEPHLRVVGDDEMI